MGTAEPYVEGGAGRLAGRLVRVRRTEALIVELPDDYADMLVELHAAGADFLLIGGWAVAVHGHGRATDDLDVLVRPTLDNAGRVYAALVEFGAPLRQHEVSEGLFAEPRYGYRFGREPLLIELLTEIDGVTFDEAAQDALTVQVAGVEIRVIGRAALIANKRASGRPKDLADLDALLRLADDD